MFYFVLQQWLQKFFDTISALRHYRPNPPHWPLAVPA